jgi:photosystem II stability/assembly factor-like uncharacterized protein
MTDDHEPDVENPVYAIAACQDFLQGGVCFAARPHGLIRSTDGGKTWEDALRSMEISADPGTLAVTISMDPDDAAVFAGAVGSILRSNDGGQTWRVARLASPPPLVSVLAVSPAYTMDGMVFAGTLEDGIFCSNDRGAHWSPWNFGLIDLSVLALVPSPNFQHDQTIFAATSTGIFRSRNGGRAWREAGSTGDMVDIAPFVCLAVSPDFANDRTLFAGTESNGMLRSRDGGEHWEPFAEAVIQGSVNTIVVAGSSGQLHLLVVCEDGMWVSRDGGERWIEQAPPDDPDGEDARVMTTACAPLGMQAGAVYLAGFLDGSVRPLSFV